jgi:hypothetical protein
MYILFVLTCCDIVMIEVTAELGERHDNEIRCMLIE